MDSIVSWNSLPVDFSHIVSCFTACDTKLDMQTFRIVLFVKFLLIDKW